MKKQLLSILFLQIISLTVFGQITLTLQPDPAAGKDAEVFSCVPCGYDNLNFGLKQDMDAIAWTNNGNASNVRSLLQFDLSSIPVGAIVTDARLSLYFNPTSQEGQHFSSLLNNNASVLRRITTPWNESTVTWNTLPRSTKTHKVLIPATTSPTQSFPNINVTNIVQDMVNNPAQSFGFILKLRNEKKFNKLLFASSDNANPVLRPKLVVTYTVPANVLEQSKVVNSNSSAISVPLIVEMDLVPNPAREKVALTISSEKNDAIKISVFNIIGKEVFSQHAAIIKGDNHLDVQTASWEKGVYLFLVKTSEAVTTRKLIIE